MLLEHTLFGIIDKERDAIEEIKAHEPPEGYYLADSGGKDSTVVRHLLIQAGVKYDGHFNLTTVDPPEVIKFVKKFHPEVHIRIPKTTMWRLIEKNRIPPLRTARYCCNEFKEKHGQGRIVVLGIRWQESSQRKKRKLIDGCRKTNMVYFSPIISWTTDDVWEYIHKYNLDYCTLYDEGHKRVGCIMCPFSRNGMKRDAVRWPKYYQNYLRAFQRVIDNNQDNHKLKLYFKTGQEMMDWWVNGEKANKPLPLLNTFKEEQQIDK